MRVFFSFLLTGAMLALSFNVTSAVDVYAFDSDSQRERYQLLNEELRCPKCQNQNLAGSDSQIAGDLRRELHRLLSEGKSDQEIKEYMVARYGDFVLYKPPLKTSTLVLWVLPFMLLLIGAIVSILVVKQRRSITLLDGEAQEGNSLSEDEASALNDLLAEQSTIVDNNTKGGS